MHFILQTMIATALISLGLWLLNKTSPRPSLSPPSYHIDINHQELGKTKLPFLLVILADYTKGPVLLKKSSVYGQGHFVKIMQGDHQATIGPFPGDVEPGFKVIRSIILGKVSISLEFKKIQAASWARMASKRSQLSEDVYPGDLYVVERNHGLRPVGNAMALENA